jgi:uncharacterized membrane protein
MNTKFNEIIKKFTPWLRSLIAFSLVAIIIFSNPTQALAKRGGGRIGGSSFRSPSRSMPRSLPSSRSTPSRSYGYGGGGSSLFFLPFFIGGGGGGSLVGLLAVMAIAGVVLQAVRNSGLDNFLGDKLGGNNTNNVTVSKIQIGLLSSARQLQQDLNRLAMEADTNTSEGLTLLLRETTVSLLRHPEYWVYADSVTENSKLELAEQKFNSLAMGERSKLTSEVVSNFNNRRGQSSVQVVNNLDLEAPSEYIVVTLITAMAGNSNLSKIRSSEELRLALSNIGAASEEQLLAVEILWEPQSSNYTLTSDEVLTIYPSLVRI